MVHQLRLGSTRTELTPSDASEIKTRFDAETRTAAIVTGIFIPILLSCLCSAFLRMPMHPRGDFFGIWSYARLISDHPIANLYDPSRLHALQVGLGMDPKADAPFPYPPFFLFFTWPIGRLPYLAAYLLWEAVTLILYLTLVCTGYPRASIGLLLLVPTTGITFSAGQSGFLLAGLMIGGLKLMNTRPVLAGILLGLLAYKPQFGLMVPVVLIAGRHWRCMLSAMVTVLLLSTLATLAFGPDVWALFWHSVRDYAKWFNARGAGVVFRTTLAADLQALGASKFLIQSCQILAIAGAAAAVWRAQRHLPANRALCVTVVASCLAVPHAFTYDLPMLSAVAVYYLLDQRRQWMRISILEGIVVLLVLAFPAVTLFVKYHLPLSSPILIAFLMLLLADLRHAPSERSGAVLPQMAEPPRERVVA